MPDFPEVSNFRGSILRGLPFYSENAMILLLLLLLLVLLYFLFHLLLLLLLLLLHLPLLPLLRLLLLSATYDAFLWGCCCSVKPGGS